MNPKIKLALYAGAAVVVFGALYWLSQQQSGGAVATTPDVTGSDNTGDQSTQAPAVFNIPGLPAAIDLASQAPSLLFNVYNNTVAPTPSAPAPVSGTGSADGNTGPCNCPNGNTSAYGSLGDAASAMGPLASVLTQFIPSSVSPWQIAEYGGANPIETALNEGISKGHALMSAANDFWYAQNTG